MCQLLIAGVGKGENTRTLAGFEQVTLLLGNVFRLLDCCENAFITKGSRHRTRNGFWKEKKKDLHQDTNASLSKVQAYPLSHGAVQALPDFK